MDADRKLGRWGPCGPWGPEAADKSSELVALGREEVGLPEMDVDLGLNPI
jgi:hypothetical protein